MSEIEKVIKDLKSMHNHLVYECDWNKRYNNTNPLTEDRCNALNDAIQALQEKAEREKGCEYCRERKPLLNEIGDLQIDDTDATLWLICQSSPDDIFEEHTGIKFCPMCGRKLVEE